MSDPAQPIFQRLDLVNPSPYPRSHYVRRLIWVLVDALLFRFTPQRAFRWHRFILRLMGAKLGEGVYVRPSARIRHPWLLSIGDHSSVGDNVLVYNLGPISIGRHTAISQNVHLCAGTHDYKDPALPLIRSSITIGSGVWICADAFIGPDVTVADNALVAARAVVTKDVPPATIVGGNPAKVIRQRPLTTSDSPRAAGNTADAADRSR